MRGNLDSYRALVCGASRGIGRAAAESLAARGAKLILLARNASELGRVMESLPKSSAPVALALDLSDLSRLRAAIQSEIKERGPIDIVINNAGGPKGGPLLNASLEEFLLAFQTHVLAAQVLAQEVAPAMKEKKFGRIINVISTSVKAPIPNLGVSNTIRGAMASWAKTLASELGPYGVTVNNVLPGYTSTERLAALKAATAERLNISESVVAKDWLSSIPAGRFGQPEDLGEAIAFLASPAASYINGINLPVDGGRTVSL